jgi:imidazolonepropionase-like amidohydrolase
MGCLKRTALVLLAALLLVGLFALLFVRPRLSAPKPLRAEPTAAPSETSNENAASLTAVATLKSAGLVLDDVTVINPGVDRRPGQTLALAGDRIERIETAPAAAERRGDGSFSGAFVLPGLIDLHHHLPPANILELSGFACLLDLAWGVTTVRDVGDSDGTAVDGARKGIAAGDFPGPRIFACGPYIDGGPPRWPNSVHLDGPADAARVVADLKRAGYDCVKAYEDLTVADLRALEAAAKKNGLQMLGHVPTQLSYEQALVPETQHFMGVAPPASLPRDQIVERQIDWHAVDRARLDRIVAVTLEHGIVNTPTLVSHERLAGLADPEAARRDPAVQLMPRMYRDVAWSPTEGFAFYRHLPAIDFVKLRDSLAKKKKLLYELYRAGAELRIGTDTPQPFVVPGASVHREMQIFHETGIPAEEVWAIATWKGARGLPLAGLGTLREGSPADLLIFRRDPTQDLRNLDSLVAVVSRGRLYPKAQLDAALAAYREHFADPVFDRLSVESARLILNQMVKRDY